MTVQYIFKQIFLQCCTLGSSTGDPTKPSDLNEINGKTSLPILIGSGVTLDNLDDYYTKSHGIIVGSYFKENGRWNNEILEERVEKFMEKFQKLRQKSTS